jgi:hypothetical protein
MLQSSIQQPLLQRLGRLSLGPTFRALVAISMIWLGRGGSALAQQPNSGQMPFVNWITTLSDSGYTVTDGSETDFPGCTDFQGAYLGAENFTGSAVQFLQGPYIICDTATGC